MDTENQSPTPAATPKPTPAQLAQQKAQQEAEMKAVQAKQKLAAQEVYKQQVGKRFKGDLKKIHGTAGQPPSNAPETIVTILKYEPKAGTITKRGAEIEERQCFLMILGNPNVQHRYPCAEFMAEFKEVTGEIEAATETELPR